MAHARTTKCDREVMRYYAALGVYQRLETEGESINRGKVLVRGAVGRSGTTRLISALSMVMVVNVFW